MKKTFTLILVACAWLGWLLVAEAQTLTRVTMGPIVTDQGSFIRGTWGDFHNDGRLDLVVCNYNGINVYYRNDGSGVFTKILTGYPVQDSDYHVQANIGDYDNDGFLDLLITSGTAAPNPRRSLLYHNNGDGTFSPASGGGITNQLGYFSGSAWADYDNDGLLDLFIGNQGSGLLSLLWHNNGDGTFTRITGRPPVDVTGGGAAVWADYDNDGFMDLLVVGESTSNYLYHNNRDGTFQRILTNAIASDDWPGGVEAGTWGDYDNDGLLDLFVTGDSGSPNRLYRNNGNGTFKEMTDVPMASNPNGSLACAWGDYDNDGYLDLFLTSQNAPNALYHNNGDGTFTQVLDGDPVNDGGNDLIAGWVDYDNDGFLDLFVTQLGATPVSNLLYHNQGNTNSWLEVKLVGTVSNRSAIGAKVRVHASIRGKTMWQMREITNGGSRWDQPLVAHFGLSDATNAEIVRIEWPSGIVQTMTNVAGRQILTVVEHQSGVTNAPTFSAISHATNGGVNLSVSGEPGWHYLFEGSTNLVSWSWLGVRSNAVGTVQFTDLRATNYPSRFYRVSIP
jgi:hypothetical protein